MQQTFDGGYVLAGEAYTDVVYKDVYLIRVGPQSQSFVYDGDGHRVKKISGQETVLYINKYYEKNLKTGEVTTHYYLGDREVAYRKGPTLEYLHQDHLGSTVLTTNTSGAVVATVAYFPYGGTRSTSGGLNTDKRFTGQRLDQLDLYYYNARYYDATIGRFVSPDTMVPDYVDPQSLNPYTYCLNSPLVYIDPTGNFPWRRICDKVLGVAAFATGSIGVVIGVTSTAASLLTGQVELLPACVAIAVVFWDACVSGLSEITDNKIELPSVGFGDLISGGYPAFASDPDVSESTPESTVIREPIPESVQFNYYGTEYSRQWLIAHGYPEYAELL